MEVTEKTQVGLPTLLKAYNETVPVHVRDKVSPSEVERIQKELLSIAERVVARYGLSIAESRRLLIELVGVTV